MGDWKLLKGLPNEAGTFLYRYQPNNDGYNLLLTDLAKVWKEDGSPSMISDKLKPYEQFLEMNVESLVKMLGDTLLPNSSKSIPSSNEESNFSLECTLSMGFLKFKWIFDFVRLERNTEGKLLRENFIIPLLLKSGTIFSSEAEEALKETYKDITDVIPAEEVLKETYKQSTDAIPAEEVVNKTKQSTDAITTEEAVKETYKQSTDAISAEEVVNKTKPSTDNLPDTIPVTETLKSEKISAAAETISIMNHEPCNSLSGQEQEAQLLDELVAKVENPSPPKPIHVPKKSKEELEMERRREIEEKLNNNQKINQQKKRKLL